VSGTEKRWRSKAVKLALLGSTGGLMSTTLAGCSLLDRGTYHRNVYSSFADCIADYPSFRCSPAGFGSGGHQLGPVYRMVGGVPRACNSSDPGPGSAARGGKSPRISVQSVKRGGFGTACATRSTSRRYGSRSSWSRGG
jgi:hypothetical protein